MKTSIKKALGILNNITSSNEINAKKAQAYILIAICEELQTLNRILAAKFNIELVEKDNSDE